MKHEFTQRKSANSFLIEVRTKLPVLIKNLFYTAFRIFPSPFFFLEVRDSEGQGQLLDMEKMTFKLKGPYYF